MRHHLFLVVKEALNNTVKHSLASEVWLRFRATDSGLEIKIEDNGRGFVPGADHSFGNGLANMKKRMDDLGGGFEVKSAPGAGTQIKVKLDFPPEIDHPYPSE